MKQLLHRMLRSRGYEICRRDRFGVDFARDFNRIFRERSVKVVFDVGANEGQTAIEYTAAFPEAMIHSFEPFDQSFEALRRRTDRFSKIKPVKIALGDVSGTHKLFVNKSSPTNSLLPNSPEVREHLPNLDMAAVGTTEIEVTTLDDYCAGCNIEFVDLLKLDVQGYEQRVLQGANLMLSQRKIAAIFTEVLFTPLYSGQAYFQDLYTDLWKHGFRLTYLYNPSFNPKHYLSWCDALFVHPDVLARRLGE